MGSGVPTTSGVIALRARPGVGVGRQDQDLWLADAGEPHGAQAAPILSHVQSRFQALGILPAPKLEKE